MVNAEKRGKAMVELKPISTVISSFLQIMKHRGNISTTPNTALHFTSFSIFSYFILFLLHLIQYEIYVFVSILNLYVLENFIIVIVRIIPNFILFF
jgi:hypothetical protein